jgi:phytoene dehydrogenase-like protein
MTIPSAHDDTLAKPGFHIVQLFIQYAPYEANGIAEYNGKNPLQIQTFIPIIPYVV